MELVSFFEYSFMVRALLAGSMIGLIAPVLGIFLIAKRYSVMADSLSHVSLAGVAFGWWLGIPPLVSGLVAALVSATVVEKLRQQQKISGELAMAMLLSGGLALAVVLSSLNRSFNLHFMSYLFGSITTVTPADLYAIVGLVGLVISVFLFFHRQFLYVVFDEEAALVSGIPVSVINMLFIVLTATTIILSMPIVGALLIGALMIIPPVTAMQLRCSFWQTVAWSMVFSLLAVVTGLISAFYLDVAAGGAIVLCSLGLFGVITLTNTKK